MLACCLIVRQVYCSLREDICYEAEHDCGV
jgi:hypothetical protein